MSNDSAMAEATGWHLRQAEMTEADWATFVAWLEVPANARAYDAVALADRLLDDIELPAVVPASLAVVPANDIDPLPAAAPSRRGARWGWGVGGLAIAAGLAVLALPLAPAPSSQPYWIETQPGEHRSVALADGTRIEVNGATRLGLDRADPRVATLERGEAAFHVAHDANRPFAVVSRGITIRDVGTVFDVARDGTRLDVAVAEGAVLFQPDADRVALAAGQGLSLNQDRRQLRRFDVAPDLVGGWRSGRLAFADATLDTVAAAVERRYGIDLALDSRLSGRSFTGMVSMSGTAQRDIPHLAALIGAGWRRKGDGWLLVPESDPVR